MNLYILIREKDKNIKQKVFKMSVTTVYETQSCNMEYFLFLRKKKFETFNLQAL